MEQKQTKITINGDILCQKNMKQPAFNKRTGRMFILSKPKFKNWRDETLTELDKLDIKFTDKVIKIDYMFYVSNNIRKDLDNMIATINDLLQTAGSEYGLNSKGKLAIVKGTGIISGDHWQVLKIGSADAKIDKLNPRCELTITEL